MTHIEPTEEQKEAVEKTVKWWKTGYKQVWEIAGSAGTGKTTIVYLLIEALGLKREDVLFMAYVGKATLALTRKGNFAQTIHSTIYYIQNLPKEDSEGNIITKNGRAVTTPQFVKKESLQPNIKLLVLDEGPMVAADIAQDILSFGLPLIVLGDLKQLPPVYGDSFFLQHPDIVLTKPMRQALDSPIIYLADLASQGKRIPYGKYSSNCFVIKKDELTDNMLTKCDITICGKNSTREDIIKHVRKDIYHIDTDYPKVGEKMICRQNDWSRKIDDNIFLTNGLIGYVMDVKFEQYNKRTIPIDFRPEFLDTDWFSDILIDYQYLLASYEQRKKMPRSRFEKMTRFEYAYAITAHLAQGSQYKKVLVYNERLGDFDYYKRWLYTAITRAEESIIIAI